MDATLSPYIESDTTAENHVFEAAHYGTSPCSPIKQSPPLGYVQESNNDSAGCNIHQVTGKSTSKKGELANMKLEHGSRESECEPKTDYVTDSMPCSSGYMTESRQVPSDYYYRQKSCGPDALVEQHTFRHVAHSVGSSGYASESVTGDLISPSTGSKLVPWQSQTSLESDSTDNTTNLGEAENSVKFTINGHQGLEYVNHLEENFYNDVVFDLDTCV